MAATRRRAFTAYVQHHLPRGIIIGGMAISSYGLALYALSQGAMAPVAALRETSAPIVQAQGFQKHGPVHFFERALPTS